VNSLYAFALRRKERDAPWTISKVQTDLSDGGLIAPGRMRPSAQHYINFPINVPYVTDATLPELVKSPHFSPTEIRLVPRNGRALVKVQFVVSQPTSKKPGALKGGWFLLDPDFMWVQRESDLKIQWKGKVLEDLAVNTTFEYREDAVPFPVLARTVQSRKTTVAGQMTEEMRWTHAFDLLEADVPESEFTLSAFGFTEPPGFTKRATPWHLWAAFAGIGCIASAVFFRRRAQRRQAAVGATK